MARRKMHHTAIYDEVADYFKKANESEYYKSLDEVMPGISNFHKHTIFNMNTYFHFLFFQPRKHHIVCDVFNAMYIPDHKVEEDPSNYKQIVPPTIWEMKGLKKFARYIIRERMCIKCKNTYPTYTLVTDLTNYKKQDSLAIYIPQDQLLTTEKVKEVLTKIFQIGEFPYIRTGAFGVQYNLAIGWNARCIECLKDWGKKAKKIKAEKARKKEDGDI